ncbi:MAG: hydroxyethylthiazole kinase [Oscillospiraceae bacterium]|nr:hydroxyethylthiazole kinase [Oscillospiraceae bacterium]
MINNLGNLVNEVRSKKPLIHHITNYVTVNDCANITLAIGASPVMADDIGEAADIVGIASAVVLNMGTLNERTIKAMLAAGKAANAKNIPVVFDPVGAGASKLRNDTAADIIREVKIAVLRGNISEIKFIAGIASKTKGVDAAETDSASLESAGEIAKNLAEKLGCVVVISGAVDVISDGERLALIENGVAMLSNLTGTGCMCTSLVGSFCGAAPNAPFEAAVCAMLTMGIAGEHAFEEAGNQGNASFHTALLNAISLTTSDTIQKMSVFTDG